MHVQMVDLLNEAVICPDCRTLQNIEVVRHDEETDMLSGQRCWYCGGELDDADISDGFDFQVVLSSSEVPSNKASVARWTSQLEHRYGATLTGYHFDKAGRCVVTLHPVATSDGDLDLPIE